MGVRDEMMLFYLPLLILALCSVTWIYYVAIIRLYHERARLRTPAYVMAVLGVIVGLPLDIFLNLVFSVVALDVPREVTLSQHLSRLNNNGGWRGDISRWICAELLDPFDPKGYHCK